MKVLYQGLIATTCCVMAFGCSSTNDRAVTTTDTTYRDTAKEKKQARVATVDFDRGTPRLGLKEKQELNALIQAARSRGKIAEVKVLAWGDADYSADNRKAPSTQIDLADARAKNIRTYIRDSLNFTDIDSHNMAERPGVMAKLFKTEDYELKTGTYEQDGKTFTPSAEPQKALVFVEME